MYNISFSLFFFFFLTSFLCVHFLNLFFFSTYFQFFGHIRPYLDLILIAEDETHVHYLEFLCFYVNDHLLYNWTEVSTIKTSTFFLSHLLELMIQTIHMKFNEKEDVQIPLELKKSWIKITLIFYLNLILCCLYHKVYEPLFSLLKEIRSIMETNVEDWEIKVFFIFFSMIYSMELDFLFSQFMSLI
jgi:hypothetical protein